MTDKPILFSAPMVRALLDGRKTQTRRALKEQPPAWATFCQQTTMLNILHNWVPSGMWRWSEEEQSPPRPLRQWPIDKDGNHYWLRPSYSIRDRLWVRETWAPLSALTHNDPGVTALADNCFYRADNSTVEGEISRWKPSIFMPRWASRLTLIVTDVRVERLQNISRADAIAEGLVRLNYPDEWWDIGPEETPCISRDPIRCYRNLWNRINGDKAWDANPYVAAYTFRVIKQNIDQIREDA